MSTFLAWGDFHARSRFACSTIPEEKWVEWGTTCSVRVMYYGREVVGFIPATSCIPVLLKTADDVVNLLTRNIYLVVVSVSTSVEKERFHKTDHFDKNSTTLDQVITPGGIRF